jgi:predicted small integral membrane protein
MLALRAPAARFDAQKSWSILGATMGFAVWFLGFMLVGGEWFQMWQSSQWNGQAAAFRFYMPLMAGLIFIAMPEAKPSQKKDAFACTSTGRLSSRCTIP